MSKESKKKKLSCFIGDHLNDTCALTWFKANKENVSVEAFKDCTADITEHLKSYNITETCVNTTEQWLIKNRLELEIPDEAEICPKHRLKFGVGFTLQHSCKYPGDESCKVKQKKKQVCRVIPISFHPEIQLLFSSAAKKFRLPIGSGWCNNCRLRLHCCLMEKNNMVLDNSICKLFSETHHVQNIQEEDKSGGASNICQEPNAEPFSDDEPGSSHLDNSFTDDTPKDSFNRSMSAISSDWTPLKFQQRRLRNSWYVKVLLLLTVFWRTLHLGKETDFEKNLSQLQLSTREY